MFLLIWGFKVRFRTTGEGEFFCPRCGGDRHYQRRTAKRWFHLYYVPLIPGKVVGEVIRCTTCNTDFNESVLTRPTTGQFSELLQNAVRGVMVLALRATGPQDALPRAAAVAEIAKSGATGYTEDNLDADLQIVPDDLGPFLAPLAEQLADQGKEALVGAAVRVACSDGPMQEHERQLMNQIGAQLGLTPAHVAGVIATAGADTDVR